MGVKVTLTQTAGMSPSMRTFDKAANWLINTTTGNLLILGEKNVLSSLIAEFLTSDIESVEFV